MNIFIITEGGKNIGFGHITRCISLSEVFEKKNIKPDFIVNGDNTAAGLLTGRRHRILNWIKKKNVLFRLIRGADIAIIDSYLADISLYKAISGLVKTAVYVDDNARLGYPKGIVINGSIYADNLRYRCKRDSRYLLGIKYFPLRKLYRHFPRKRIRKCIKRIMITFGGDDKQNLTPKILDFLNKEYSQVRKDVIIGGGFQNLNIRRINGLKGDNTKLIYKPDSELMKRTMLNSDIAISAGGQTLYELAKAGVPTIGICVARNQHRNLTGWRNKGFLEFIGWYYQKELLKKLKKAIFSLLPYEERKKRRKIGVESIDGKGVERIVDFLVKHRGQKAN